MKCSACSLTQQTVSLPRKPRSKASSCGNAAGRFLGETNQLFQDIGAVGNLQTLHYLECDAQIQKELAFDGVQSLEQVETRKMYGWGGTDFRPVFKRAEEYIRNGEEISLLIYLTDGDGVFPDEKPDYPVWFVMPKSDYENHKRGGGGYYAIPEWVTPLCLN